jgi:hypothetical protein
MSANTIGILKTGHRSKYKQDEDNFARETSWGKKNISKAKEIILKNCILRATGRSCSVAFSVNGAEFSGSRVIEFVFLDSKSKWHKF